MSGRASTSASSGHVIANGYELNEEIRVRVLVKPARADSGPIAALETVLPTGDSTRGIAPVESGPQPHQRPTYRPGGPLMALASVVVPGLGNVFVQSPKPKVGWRPLLTMGVASALVYGFGQRSQAQEQYAQYTRQKNPDAAEPYFQRANDLQHRYYAATRLAAAVWLGDIIATFVRGLRNQRQRAALAPVSLRLNYQSTVPVAALTLRF